MNPEALDEIEKLAEAETVDRWSAAEAGFNAAMRKYALPLVKALREAHTVIGLQTNEILYRCAEAQVAIAERDESQAEVKRLNQLNSSLSEDLQRLYQREARGLADWEDLRAEVDRLKSQMRAADDLIEALREQKAELLAEKLQLRDLVRDLQGYITPTQEQFAPILARVDAQLKDKP